MRGRRFRRQSLNYRAEQAGLLSAGGAAPLAHQRTLMPRNTVDQAMVSGLALSTNHALVTLVQETLQSAALLALGQGGRATVDERAWSRAALGADALGLGAGLVIQRAFPARYREPLPRAAVRSGGYWLARTAAAGLVIGALQEGLGRVGTERGGPTVPVFVPAVGVLAGLGEWRRRHEARLDGETPDDEQTSRLKAGALGLAVTAATMGLGSFERKLADTVTGAVARVLPGNAALWRPVGHAASLAMIATGSRALMQKVFGRIERQQESVEPAFDIPPPLGEVSGSLASEVPFDSLARAGRRFVWTLTTPDRIELVMGEPARRTPARVYVGLASADDDESRVALAMRELDRVGAFEREWLMIALPTGTGYVNYAAVTTLEMLTRGDCTTVAMQYAARPSPLSLDRVSTGRQHARLLIDTIADRLAALPAGRRPKVLLFGESLGAWTSQDAFIGLGTRGLADAGIDRAIWIGTPYFSEWKEQVLHDEAPDIDRSVVGVFSRIEEWRALDPEARSRIRYVMITHHDDGVALFGPELAIRAPDWLGDPEHRPEGVPKGMRWMPSTTFFHVLVDMKNAANVVPGVLEAKGHDYRADLLPFFHETLGLDATPQQLERVTSFLMETELRRARWMSDHRTSGKSLSATLATRWMQQEYEAGRDPSDVLVRAFRALVDETASEEPAAEGDGRLSADGPRSTKR